MIVDQSYFKNMRSEVAALVDISAKSILDVGCGSGTLGTILKSIDPSRKVTGIEADSNAAKEASTVLDKVINADIESLNVPASIGDFDCIIFADILEHLKDPLSTLRKLEVHLKKDGFIVCSIPNTRHFTAFFHLLLNGWEYKDSGLFDRTHLRFFSLRSMKQLITDAGLTIELIRPKIELNKLSKPLNLFGKSIDPIVLKTYSKTALLLNILTLKIFEEFLTYQYLIRAKK